MPDLEPDDNVFANQDSSKGSSYYYRGSKPSTEPGKIPYIDPDQLQTLAEGHFGITNLLLGSFAIVILFFFVSITFPDTEIPPAVGIAYFLSPIPAIFVCYITLTKIAAGLGWIRGLTVPISIVLGLNVLLCGGGLGFVILQQITSAALKRYGLKVHSLGIRRQDVAKKVEEMRFRKQAESQVDIRLG